jgi:hypothetical protein
MLARQDAVHAPDAVVVGVLPHVLYLRDAEKTPFSIEPFRI